jgi:hypothetical protein
MLWVGGAHFVGQFHGCTDLYEVAFAYAGAFKLSLVLPQIAVLHVLGPEGICPALDWLDCVNAAACRGQEMTLRASRLAQPKAVRRTEDVALLEFGRFETQVLRDPQQVALGDVHESPSVAALRATRLTLEAEAVIHRCECIASDA